MKRRPSPKPRSPRHEKVLGPEHAWTKASASVTADALAALGRAAEAAELRARYKLQPPPSE
ncbi:MAG TPA: hypothetical protein VME69_00085 [Methylocella sp.]|nr:hypothetical protein [Methylocella sp.]